LKTPGKISDTSFGWTFRAAIFPRFEHWRGASDHPRLCFGHQYHLERQPNPSALILPEIPSGTTAPLRLEFKIAKSMTAEPLFFNAEPWFLPDFLLR
jgi:hypothetical protein